ncbi:MAG: FN3 associated domain-containing protein [Saprospiraceae bacterium]
MMRFLQIFVFSMVSFSAISQNTFKLAPPYLQFESAFFTKECRVSIEFDHPKTKIHYTTNGQTPTENDPVYSQPVLLNQASNILKARVFLEGYSPSDVVEASFYKSGLTIDSVTTTLPNKFYPGSGPKALIDGKGGWNAFNHKTWTGFLSDTVTIDLNISKPQKIKSVLLHLLENQAAWIYLPQKVEVFAAKDGKDNYEMIARETIEPGVIKGNSNCRALSLKIKKSPKTSRILLNIYPMVKIPEGLPGAGERAWLFIDEVNLY